MPMSFEWFFSRATARFKNTQKQVSSIIVLISQISILLGIVVTYLTFSIGLGTRHAIKEKLAAFSGHVLITGLDSNDSYDSSPVSLLQSFYPIPSWRIPVANLSEFAMKGGIIRTEKDTEGVVFKGVSSNYDWSRFKDFIVKGRKPDLKVTSLSYEVLLSKKMAAVLGLDIGASFVVYFFREPPQVPVARRFFISGLYDTGIKNFDQMMIIGDLRQVRRINHWQEDHTGGFEVFVKDIDKIEALEKEINEHISYDLKAQGVLTRFESIRNWMGIFDINILIVTLIMSLVVMINMMVLLLILILERSYTVGVLKTLGASNGSIRKIFIYYALHILGPALLWGNLIALGLLFLQKYFGLIHLDPEAYYISFVPVYLNPELVAGINLAAILLSLLTLWLFSVLINTILPIKSVKFR